MMRSFKPRRPRCSGTEIPWVGAVSCLGRLLVAAVLLASLATENVSAADKSGVTPNAISLPKGPGAIEGLGESFQPTLNTGTADYGINLKVPPGTRGHAPALRLRYEGGGGNGPVGFGWSLPVACVQRRSDKGIPTYGKNVGFARQDTFMNQQHEELVPLTNGFWFARNEAAFIRYRQVSNYWEGVLPNGTVMEFGVSANARIAGTETNEVFSWLLERERDTHGNTIVYSYGTFPGENNQHQTYLLSVAYGPGPGPWDNFHFITLAYEDRPDWFEDCRAGFVVRTGKRLKEITVATQGPVLTNHLAGDFNADGKTDYLDRKYALEYTSYAGTNSHWSLLAKITVVGADGVTALPPATFGYTICNPPDTLAANDFLLGGSNEPPTVMDNSLVDFLDLNGDGLPDILRTDVAGSTHWAYLNRGEFGNGPNRSIQWRSVAEIGSEDGRALQFNLQSVAPIAHLADMDGDGIADLAVTALDGSVLYFPNRGTLSWGARRDMSIEDFAPPSPFGNPDVRTADLDFDKRIDVVQSISSGSGADYRIWFNLGNQSYSAGITVPQGSGFMLSSSGVHIADFNGDRVPDIVSVRPDYLMVTAGLGYGRFTEARVVPIPDTVLDDTQVAKVTLTDINGDGLVDLVLERASPGQLWYWLNLGNYRLSSRKTITGMPVGIGAVAVVRWADINGNGTTDLIYADSSSEPRLQTVEIGELLNGGGAPNLLVAISNGIGRATAIGYQSSTVFALADAAAGKPWPDLMPNPVSVVSAITNFDSLGHQYISRYRYHNGYYDSAEKQFRGFAQTEQIDEGDLSAPTLVTRSIFDTGRDYEALKGKVLVVSVEEDDGKVFSLETNSWTVPPPVLYTGLNGSNVVFAHPTGSIRIISELGKGPPRRLETEHAYDTYGNETTNINYGIVENGDRAAWNDERIVITDYALNLEAWIIRMPHRTETRTLAGAVISRTEQFYDDPTFSGGNPGTVTLGDLTLGRAWITPSNSTDFVQAARGRYDTYGNQVLLLDALGVAAAGQPDLSKGHAREVVFDPRFFSYPVSEIIHVGGGTPPLVYQAGYDEGFGNMRTSVDFNDHPTSFGYDPLGRLIRVVKPLDSPAYPTVEYDYVLAQPVAAGLVNYIETRELDRDPGTAGGKIDHYHVSRQYVDGFGRVLMHKQEAEPETPGGPERAIISGAVQFNARSEPALRVNACFSLLPGPLNSVLAFEDIGAPGWQGQFCRTGQLVTLNLASADKTSTRYDALLRDEDIINQDGSSVHTSFEPLVTKIYDENQTSGAPYPAATMVQFRDGLSRLARVDELVRLKDDGTPSTDTNAWTTTYEYDANDQLTRITDSQNNVKLVRYDGLKRKTFSNDPDRGEMSYQYDGAGNLTGTTDAKNQHITYTYDGVNRLLTETYVGSALSPRLGEDRGEGMVNVAYHYDAPTGMIDQGDGTTAVAQNTRAMLAYVSDGSGEEHLSYDERGRMHYTVKRIPDMELVDSNTAPASVLVAYRTIFDYDSMDRLSRLVYPDNDEVRYEYNERTLLKRIIGGPSGSVISNLVYWPSDQQRRVDFGNGVQTTHGYDSRLRLQTLFTAPGQTSDKPFVAFNYELDPASNIRRIEDARPGSVVPAGDKRRNTQMFDYDDLYRLTRVRYSFNAPGTPVSNDGQIDYRFDRIGNLLSQTSSLDQQERGFPVADLGSLGFGGSAGAANRVGRAPADPPGPHALTQISGINPPSIRAYPYDANGNMLTIDGLACTWDFKDRLVAAEDGSMRAEYTYDYTDRRITKRVIWKSK